MLINRRDGTMNTTGSSSPPGTSRKAKDLFGDCALVEIIHLHDCFRKVRVVLFYHVNSCVQYDALVIWPLHLTFVYLYLIAFTPHALTYVTITSLST